jgi:formylglycine-generating enzyme required for sulfatase activity
VLTWPGDGVEMAFRLIPAGSFRMGARGYQPDEEPVHEVRIPEPFWMAETPVTQAQLALWTRAEGIVHANHFPGCSEFKEGFAVRQSAEKSDFCQLART